MIVVLHNIRSVYNVGSIFRTADAAGVREIYCCGITATPLDRFGVFRKDFTKVSLGAEKFVLWRKYKSIIQAFTQLKNNGYTIIAVEQNKASIPYYKFRVKKSALEKIVLVLGNEVKGLPLSVLKHADKVLEIPMFGRKESLNVGVAFGVVVFHLVFGIRRKKDYTCK